MYAKSSNASILLEEPIPNTKHSECNLHTSVPKFKKSPRKKSHTPNKQRFKKLELVETQLEENFLDEISPTSGKDVISLLTHTQPEEVQWIKKSPNPKIQTTIDSFVDFSKIESVPMTLEREQTPTKLKSKPPKPKFKNCLKRKERLDSYFTEQKAAKRPRIEPNKNDKLANTKQVVSENKDEQYVNF